MKEQSIYKFKFNELYKLYVAKVERKGRNIDEVNEVISWLTGYTKTEIANFDNEVDMETFFKLAKNLNPNRSLIKGAVCGVKVEEVEESIMKEIRYLDKLIDELAKGKSMDKILRK